LPPECSKTLGDLCFLVKETSSYKSVNPETYVSTDSMLTNKAGIVRAESIPSNGTVNKYQPKDILISNIRPYFRKIWQSNRHGTCSNDVLVIRAKDERISDYLFALLSEDRFFDHVMLGSKGTKMPRGDKVQILNYPVYELKLSKMLTIGYWISLINHKIKCNLAINDNLLHICKTHYQKIASDSLETVLLSDLAEVCYGKDHKHLNDGIYPVYGSGGIMRFCQRPLYQGKESVLIPRKGSLNNVMFVSEPFWSVDTMFYTKMKNEYACKYLYFWLSGLNLADMNSGSAVPSMTTDILNEIEVRYPGDAMIESFDRSVQPMFDLIRSNTQQITRLIKIRDCLLPKLMTGEIDVSTLDLPTKYSFGGSSGYILLVCILHILLIHHSIMERCIYPYMAEDLLNLFYWHAFVYGSGGHGASEFVRVYVLY